MWVKGGGRDKSRIIINYLYLCGCHVSIYIQAIPGLASTRTEQRGSNRGPPHHESRALPTEQRGPETNSCRKVSLSSTLQGDEQTRVLSCKSKHFSMYGCQSGSKCPLITRFFFVCLFLLLLLFLLFFFVFFSSKLY